ncbi:hypothetical protein [Empedobacter brevis]|uniref:hypothetical protein n=1 Tax=Empedobacter brevis TaxID=247 RepID=UPI002FDFDD84
MRKYQDPINFIEEKIVNDKYTIKYLYLNEIAQGSPLIGALSINNKIIKTKKFGGPFIFKNDVIYIPYYKKTFFKSGFCLCKIDLNTLSIINIDNRIFNIIDLIEIKENKIFFYKSLFEDEIISVNLL